MDVTGIDAERVAGWPSFHPERYCHECGNPNIGAWFVSQEMWNDVFPAHVIRCPQCFTAAYEAKHGRCVWELVRKV